MLLDRTWYNTLVDDTLGPIPDGTIWNKAAVDALMDAVDAALPKEGSWTPVLGGAGGTSGQTYTVQVGRYIKTGQLVQAQCYAVLSAKGTITGNVQIQGLPFVSENTANLYAHAAVYWNNTATSWVNLQGYIPSNTSAITIVGNAAAAIGSSTNLTTADIGNTTQMMVTILYRAAP